MTSAAFESFSFMEYLLDETKDRAKSFRKHMEKRRTVRHFSNTPVSREIIEKRLLARAWRRKASRYGPGTLS